MHIATKAVSPVEVLDAHLATIARVNPKLNAIVALVADVASVSAKAAEAAVMRVIRWVRCKDGRSPSRT